MRIRLVLASLIVLTGVAVLIGGRANVALGDPNLPNEISRLHYHTMYLPTILDRIEKTAPKGADLKGWRY